MFLFFLALASSILLSTNAKMVLRSLSLPLPLATRLLLALSDLTLYAVRRSDGTVNRYLMNLIDFKVRANPIPCNKYGVASHDVVVDSTRNLWFRLFVPRLDAEPSTSLPVMVFFHGGGFAFMSAGSILYDIACRRLAYELNVVVCSVDYRLAPEHKLPSQYEDGFDVVTYLDKDVKDVPSWPMIADVSRCFVAGDSAGGNLAHYVTVRACTTRFSTLKVIGLINIQPFFQGKERLVSEVLLEGAPFLSMERTKWMWQAVLPQGLDRDHWAVNVSGPNAVDVSKMNFPPTIVFVGGLDPLQDWQRRYYEWLRRSGKKVKLVEYPNAIHAFYVFKLPELPEARLLYDEVKEFIKEQSKLDLDNKSLT